MKNLFPRCEEYLEKIKLNEVEATRTNVGRLKYLCKKLKKPQPTDLELPLILDLDLIMSSIKAKTCHEINAMYEHEILAGAFSTLRRTPPPNLTTWKVSSSRRRRNLDSTRKNGTLRKIAPSRLTFRPRR
jgi:hypothetical protein